MNYIATAIPDVLLIKPDVYGDSRGFFMETFRADQMASLGITLDFVQDNHSRSRQHTLRGLHYQLSQPQGKLVRVVSGEIFDVAVDLRRSSPFYSCWVGEFLSEENKKMLWIPPGFAHGFLVLSTWADVLYKATAYYSPEGERTLLWCDPAIGIGWPIPAGQEPVLSQRDATGVRLADAEIYE